MSEHAPPRGKFIAVEGIDGAGTTTQVQRLTSWLRAEGQPCHATREPSDGPIGVQIRQILRGRIVGVAGAPVSADVLALLFAADRLDHVASEIEPALQRGESVVTDRYVGSSLAYQSLDLPLEWVRRINSRAVVPDLVVYVRVTAEVALERISARDADRRERFETHEQLRRVVATYDELGAAAGDWWIVDGSRSLDEVTAAIREGIETRLA